MLVHGPRFGGKGLGVQKPGPVATAGQRQRSRAGSAVKAVVMRCAEHKQKKQMSVNERDTLGPVIGAPSPFMLAVNTVVRDDRTNTCV